MYLKLVHVNYFWLDMVDCTTIHAISDTVQ